MRRAAIIAATLLLAGCSAFDPFPAAPAAAGKGSHESGARVAVCSDGLVSSQAEVRAAAQAQCPPHTVATRLATDWYLQYCPLLLPARTTFLCSPNK